MMLIEGTLVTTHRHPPCVAEAIRIDNLSAMRTEVAGGQVKTTITGTKLRSVIASVDDYLMNLAVAEETCRHRLERPGNKGTGKVRQQHTKN